MGFFDRFRKNKIVEKATDTVGDVAEKVGDVAGDVADKAGAVASKVGDAVLRLPAHRDRLANELGLQPARIVVAHQDFAGAGRACLVQRDLRVEAAARTGRASH